jgi:type VI protein secretion system component Hcp
LADVPGVFLGFLAMIHVCQIAGVKADICRLEGYANWFFLESFVLSVANRGGTIDDAAFNPLKLTKTIDSCSPQLMAVCCKGASFGPLEIHVLETSGSGISGKVHPIFKMKFGHLKVESWSIDKTTETIDLVYRQAACQFSQGKCDYKTLLTTYTDTPLLGFQLFTAADERKFRGGDWDGS